MNINNLSELQIELADRLWAAEDPWTAIDSMPSRLRPMAITLVHLMIAEGLDQVMDTDLAESVIDSVK